MTTYDLPFIQTEEPTTAYTHSLIPVQETHIAAAEPLLSFEEEMARQEMWDSYTGVVPLNLDDKDLPRQLEKGEVVIVLPVAGAIRYHVDNLDEKTGEMKAWDEYRVKLRDGRVVVCGGKAARARFDALFLRIPQGDFPESPAISLEIRYRTLGNGHKMPVYAFKIER